MKQSRDSKGRPVRFIRKGGRVIPIRAKKRTQTHREKAKSHGRKALASWGLGVGAGAANVGTAVYLMSTEKNMGKSARKRALKQYSKFIKAARPSKIRWGETAYGMMGPGVSFGDLSIYTSKKMSKVSFLHEIGHIRSARRKFSMNRLYYNVFKGTKGATISRKTATFGQKALAYAFPYTNLIAEAEASGEALLAIKRTKGVKAAFKASKRYGLAYGTYATKAAHSALGLAMLYHGGKAGYHYLRRNKPRD